MVKKEIYNDDDHVYEICIGQNRFENWEIIDDSDNTDLWFHIENLPSCHVILKCDETIKPSKKVIKRCAYLCKINTNSAKSLAKCNVLYTPISNIEKTRIVGEVHASHCKIVQV